MQRVLPRFEFSNEVIVLGLIWGVFALGAPTRTGNYDFRHFANQEGLTLNVSRSAPPMAALEDEKLSPLKIEPTEEIVRTKGVRVIAAGREAAWPKLKPYSKFFERKISRQASHRRHIKIKLRNSISSILNVVKFIPDDTFKSTHPSFYSTLHAVTVVDNNNKTVWPTVVIPSAVQSVSENTLPKTIVAGSGGMVPGPPAKPNFSILDGKVTPSKTNSKGSGTQVVTAAPRAPSSNKPILPDISQIVAAVQKATSSSPSITAEDAFHISGEVQLSGGLAATGTNQKLDIQWQAGNEIRTAVVDYPNAHFDISVPTLSLAKITARLTDEAGLVLGTGQYDIDESDSSSLKILQGISILVEPRDSTINGQVVSAYNVGNIKVPVVGGSVFASGSVREEADKNGTFRLSGLGSQSTFTVEGYAPEHWGTRILSTAKRMLKVPVFAGKMMDSFFGLIGKDSDNSDYGVIWGEVKRKGQTVSGVQVTTTDPNAMGPIYFNELRIPDKTLTATTSNGLYAFAKVKPGLQIVSAQYDKKEIPSTLVSVAPSKVSYSEILFKATTIQGQVIDPIAQTPLSAQVTVIGANETTVSTTQGFRLKVPSSDPMLFVEAKASDDYMKSRTIITKPEAKNINLPLYKKSWLKDRLAKANVVFKPEQSILVGYVSGPEFNVQLDDALDPTVSADKSEPQIYYFNQKGELDSTLLGGVAGGNAFIITNLQPGLHTLVISSASGDITTTRLFSSDNGVVNVMALELRP